ncbi:unnamed protein product [Colletotrichum noveboracense]|uniref:HNH nuclease domain-containing protein n=1 Tax=Colletotrichum noveboracense TaxID=2664923 RepID=A0A9W4RL97_9PEZI|nr:unnamed protein product [Colletotrichum noveboracense]
MAEAFKGKGPAPGVPWADRLHILNTGTQKELDYQRQLLTYKLKEKRVKVQPSKSSGSRFWSDSADIEQMYMDEVALEAHVNFLKAKDKGEVNTLEDWLAKDNNHRWSIKYLAHKQSMEINIAVSKRDNKDQLAFRDHMLKKHCPDRRYKSCCWDPVLAEWNRREIFHTVHLFSHRFRDSMDTIFGPGTVKELFKAQNGLFLHKDIEQALDDGVLAIVPDIDLEPADLDFPLTDTEGRKQRLRDWEKSEVKEYKIIVIDPSHPTLTEEKTLSFSQGIHSLLELHGRKLKFLTDFRPRARYIWWVFLVSVTVAGWRTKNQNPDVANAITKEIRAGIRCWGTPGTYITRNVLESFIISIGHDARSFVKGDEDQKKKKKIKPDYCPLSLIAHDHAFRNIDEEDDEMDGD